MKIVYTIVLFLQIGGIFTQQNYGQLVQTTLDIYCLKNGGYDAVLKLHFGFIRGRRCIDYAESEWTADTRITNKPEAGLELICSRIHNLKDCTKEIANSMRDCFRSDQQEVIDLGYKTLNAGLEFLCDNIDDIQKATSSDDVSCMQTMEHAPEQCMEVYNSSHNDHHEADPLAALEALKVSYDAKGCSNLLRFERCTVNLLADCRDQSFSRLLETMWQYVNDEIPCDNLPKSKASTTGVVSVLLLISATINVYL